MVEQESMIHSSGVDIPSSDLAEVIDVHSQRSYRPGEINRRIGGASCPRLVRQSEADQRDTGRADAEFPEGPPSNY
jgi:hypothetical protein